MLLNRRHLRIKVLQELYAFYQSDETDYVLRERELEKSIGKAYDQYILWLSLLVDLKAFAEHRIEENKSKKLPTPEDLNPNRRFVDNKVLELFSVNQKLRKEIERLKLSWKSEEDLFRRLFRQIQASENYQNYMSGSDDTLDAQKTFLVKMFKEDVANFELLHSLLEERSIFWIDDIDLMCSMVIKTIKQVTEETDEHSPILELFKDKEDEVGFYKTLFRKTIVNDESLSELINSKTDNWELDRIAKMDVILMKMALAEAMEFKTIPLKVTVE